MRLLKIESFPNREIRVTQVRAISGKKFDYGHPDWGHPDDDPARSPTCHSLKTLPDPKNRPEMGALDIQGKPGWGGLPRFQRFSTYARRQILRAGGALEQFANHDECLFLTLTLPGSTKDAMEALARYSGMAVQRLKNWIGKRISNNMSIYTWELQKRGALHLHYVVWAPARRAGEYIASHLKEQWIRILDSICAASGVDLYRKNAEFSWASNKAIVRVDAQWCKKSVAAYLSKYVSKEATGNVTRSGKGFGPSRWYGVSRPLLAKLREFSCQVSLDSLRNVDAAAMYTDCLSVLQSYSLKCYEYRHQVGDGKTVVAYVNQEEQQSLWRELMTLTINTQDSSESTEKTLLRLIRNGVFLMRKHQWWFETWKQFCANSRPGNLIQSPISQDTTAADMVFLLDSLMYTYRYVGRVRLGLPGECNLWYTQTLEYLFRIDPDGSLGYRHLIPRKVLIRLAGE